MKRFQLRLNGTLDFLGCKKQQKKTKQRSSHDCGLLVLCGYMTSPRRRFPFTRSSCLDPTVHLQLLTSFIHSCFHWGCVECKKNPQKNKTKQKTQQKLKKIIIQEVFFYLPFGEMHCSDMNKEKVHLVCWIMCKLVITQYEYLYNCLYFFIMILERNVFIFLTSVPDVSSVGLTLWLVWWDSYLCIEPLLWWILCMQCLGNTVGNMGRSWY